MDGDGLERDVDLPELRDKSASEASDDLEDDNDFCDLSENPSYTRVPVYLNGVRAQGLIFPNDNEASDSEASSPHQETHTFSECLKTAAGLILLY